MIIVAILWSMWCFPAVLALVAGVAVLQARHARLETVLAVSGAGQVAGVAVQVALTAPGAEWRRFWFDGPDPSLTLARGGENIALVEGNVISLGWGGGASPATPNWEVWAQAIRDSEPPRGIECPGWTGTAAVTAAARPAVWRQQPEPQPPQKTQSLFSRSGGGIGRALAVMADS